MSESEVMIAMDNFAPPKVNLPSQKRFKWVFLSVLILIVVLASMLAVTILVLFTNNSQTIRKSSLRRRSLPSGQGPPRITNSKVKPLPSNLWKRTNVGQGGGLFDKNKIRITGDISKIKAKDFSSVNWAAEGAGITPKRKERIQQWQVMANERELQPRSQVPIESKSELQKEIFPGVQTANEAQKTKT